jgi:hypothetical protein
LVSSVSNFSVAHFTTNHLNFNLFSTLISHDHGYICSGWQSRHGLCDLLYNVHYHATVDPTC